MWTFTFRVNADLNEGYDVAFNQCGEPWWWVMTEEGPAAGSVDLAGAELMTVHKGSEIMWDSHGSVWKKQ